jgi:hypothetical protein
MILTIKVKLSGWMGTFEIDDFSTMGDLHCAIQQAVEEE